MTETKRLISYNIIPANMFSAEKNKIYNPTLNAEFLRRPAAVSKPPRSVKLT